MSLVEKVFLDEIFVECYLVFMGEVSGIQEQVPDVAVEAPKKSAVRKSAVLKTEKAPHRNDPFSDIKAALVSIRLRLENPSDESPFNRLHASTTEPLRSVLDNVDIPRIDYLSNHGSAGERRLFFSDNQITPSQQWQVDHPGQEVAGVKLDSLASTPPDVYYPFVEELCDTLGAKAPDGGDVVAYLKAKQDAYTAAYGHETRPSQEADLHLTMDTKIQDVVFNVHYPYQSTGALGRIDGTLGIVRPAPIEAKKRS